MKLASWLRQKALLLFCRKPEAADYPMHGVEYANGRELDRLRVVFPNIDHVIKGKVIVDFGCGRGYQSVALARAGAKRVLAVENDARVRGMAEEVVTTKYGDEPAASRIRIAAEIPADEQRSVDMIISQNSFEHFLQPKDVLRSWQGSLARGGSAYITFSPPWYAPWGAHMQFFCRLPWVHLLFSEQTVMQVRKFFRPDGAATYHQAGLAKLSIGRFERLLSETGWRAQNSRYDSVKGIRAFARIPVLRELLINRVSCVLEPPLE